MKCLIMLKYMIMLKCEIINPCSLFVMQQKLGTRPFSNIKLKLPHDNIRETGKAYIWPGT